LILICIYIYIYIFSFIHSDYFYGASSSPLGPLLLRGTPDTARVLCRSFTPKRHGQLRVMDFPKVPMWLLERDSNLRPFGRKVTNLPMSHHSPYMFVYIEMYVCMYVCNLVSCYTMFINRYGLFQLCSAVQPPGLSMRVCAICAGHVYC